MASTYGSCSDGTQNVIDDIAENRRRLHFVKDRRASMERESNVGGKSDIKSRKAWGRTPSGILAESVMTPKEINLIWAWFCATFNVDSKFDEMDVHDVASQLMSNGVFEDQDDTISFLQSIGKENTGFISYSEINIAIASYDVSPDHIFALRQFAKKIKAKKKERKKRPSQYRLEAHFPGSEGSEDPKGIMLKSKSENFVGTTKPMLTLDTESDPSISNLPMIRSKSSVAAPSPKRLSGRSKQPSMKVYAGTVTAFQKSKDQHSSETTTSIPLSPMRASSESSPFVTTPTSKVRKRLPFKKETSEDSLPMISPRPSPDESCSSISPRNMNISMNRSPLSPKLQPMTDSVSTPTTMLTPPTMRPRDRAKSGRLDLAPMHGAHFSESPPNKTTEATTMRPHRKSKTVKIADNVSELKPMSKEWDGTYSSPASTKSMTPPAPMKSCLKTVRKEFKRQLTRMSSSETNTVLDEDAPTKSLGGSSSVDFSRNSFRTRKNSDRSLKTPSEAVLKSRPSFQTVAQDDEDLPIKSPGDSRNLNLVRNSLRSSHEVTTKGKLDRVESARQLVQRVESATFLLDQKEKSGDDVRNPSTPQSTLRNNGEVDDERPVSADAGDGSSVLKNVRRSFTRQLSKMSSFAESETQGSPASSLCASVQSPGSPTRNSIKLKTPNSRDSMDSVSSFDSGAELLRFDNPRSANSSFGETILLRSRSSSELDI